MSANVNWNGSKQKLVDIDYMQSVIDNVKAGLNVVTIDC